MRKAQGFCADAACGRSWGNFPYYSTTGPGRKRMRTKKRFPAEAGKASGVGKQAGRRERVYPMGRAIPAAPSCGFTAWMAYSPEMASAAVWQSGTTCIRPVHSVVHCTFSGVAKVSSGYGCKWGGFQGHAALLA